jgi:hypothetical protein
MRKKNEMYVNGYLGPKIKKHICKLNQAMADNKGKFKGFLRTDRRYFYCDWDDKYQKYFHDEDAKKKGKSEQVEELDMLIKAHKNKGFTPIGVQFRSN